MDSLCDNKDAVVTPSHRTGITSTEAIKRMVAAGAGNRYVSRLSVQQSWPPASWLRFHCAKLQDEAILFGPRFPRDLTDRHRAGVFEVHHTTTGPR